MIIGVRTQYVKPNGEIQLLSYIEHNYDIDRIYKPISKWYKKNPYAKRISKEWICQDYRIDQQRPQRNVYSEAYIKIVSMTEMEERYFDNMIKGIEKNIEYPTVWDDGKNIYYEKTIYCPNCGEMRTSLSSEVYCEHCGFEFSEALVCPKCEALNLKHSDECVKCGFEFRKESFINNNDFEVKKKEHYNKIKCPKCGSLKSKYFHKCYDCGFDFKGKKKCPKCHEWVDEEDKYCMNCGQKLELKIKCGNCGKINSSSHRFCTGCGEIL